jgi:hypothetical protein
MRTPHPTYFAMCVLIKDLQRSVVDVYANKRLRQDFERVALPLRMAAVARMFVFFAVARHSELNEESLSSFFSANSAPLRSDILPFPIFFPAQKLHYNALFTKIRPKSAL